MLPTHPQLAFLRSHTALIAVAIFLAGCDSVNDTVESPSHRARGNSETTVSPSNTPSGDQVDIQERHGRYDEETSRSDQDSADPQNPTDTGSRQSDFHSPVNAPGRLVFASTHNGKSDIYAVNADGSDLVRVTTGIASYTGPAWSPDGTMIAYESRGVSSTMIMTMSADGSNVDRRGEGVHPAWSPDGSMLAYAKLVDGALRIVVADGNGALTVLTNDPGFHDLPTWSPAGTQIGYVSDWAGYDFAMDVYAINVDGSKRSQITRGFTKAWPDNVYYLHPEWSPDGSMIAFVYGSTVNGTFEVQIDADVRFKVAVMSSDGVFDKDLAWAGDIPYKEILDPGSLSWSPDGLGIAYSFIDCDRVGDAGCSNERSVRYVSLDGTEHGTIVKNGHSPSWRP